MPYYVYAIQTDSKLSHLCGTFADYHDAEIWERDQNRIYLKNSFIKNDSFVKMIYAQNRTHALQRIKQIQRESVEAGRP
jgi:hypothetical protein